MAGSEVGGIAGLASSLAGFNGRKSVAEGNDDEREQPAPPEGVRILGAEEAAAAVGGEAPGGDERGGHVERPAPPRPVSFGEDAPRDAGPTWSASSTGESPPPAEPAEEPPSDVPDLPHWTEPPTGVMPAIFAEGESGESADDDAWAALSGSQPRFRSEGADWSETDFGTELADEDAPKLGALADAPPDDAEVFAEQVAARRQRSHRRTAPAGEARRRPAPGARAAAPRSQPDEEMYGPEGGRDLFTALVTAGIVAVVALICFNAGETATSYLSAAIIGLATVEFSAGLRAKGFKPATLLAILASVTLVISAREYGTAAYPIFFALVVVFSMLWFLWEVTPGRPLIGVATTVLAFGYVGGLGGFAGLLLQSNDGVGLLLGVVICTVAYDVFGYFVGSQFGKSHIAPRISPNKTFEGTLAGMTASVVLGWLVVGGGIIFSGIHPWNPGRGLALGALVALAAFFGDLCESMIKRDLGIKDFGTLLPGHGGVLDRFDGLLFSLPVAYYLAVHLGLI